MRRGMTIEILLVIVLCSIGGKDELGMEVGEVGSPFNRSDVTDCTADSGMAGSL